MMKRTTLLLTALLCACATQQQTPTTTTTTTTTTQAPVASNVFFQPSPLQFQAPQFNLINDAAYQPAIEEGMRQQLAEIDAIANDPAPPTFENTLVPMERSGALLTRVAKVFFNLAQSNTNETLQKIEEAESPKFSAHQDAIFMNPKLFARVKAIYDQRDSLGLDAESKFLVERYDKNFVRAGALLSEADKTKLRALNQEEATLTTQFRSKVLADTKESGIVVDNLGDLAGLPQSDIDAAAQAAKDRNLTGKWVIALQNTTQQPALTYIQSPALRARILAASEARGNHGGPNDTKAIVTRLSQLRADKAQLLGFPTYAAYSLDDQMAKSPENAFKLMTDMVPASTARARAEAADMQKLSGAPVTASDWEFYAE
ncbi:MAG TPA: M3 family metallopeptidase, partial [Thermoanaerobaculia bacterium]|nr:M3 family metallopeptidase [Thermoanaerobaculia bacterium]